ncbi:hypothetical protein AA3271_2475 [Gluconobacter japonicus NBRC 3271]|nr:hypothetical protein AA3271_2475 [Gluconobacter japonicus NBRC 3271]
MLQIARLCEFGGRLNQILSLQYPRIQSGECLQILQEGMIEIR